MAQHQTENSLLDTSNLKLLVLDEADRLLDPTFREDLEVRYVYELFQLLRPYFKTLQLRGNMNQQKRFQVYDRFANSPHDFPNVHWVVQFDCPHYVEDYIHRIGRTARHGHTGRSLLFLLPSESSLIDILAKYSVVLRPVKFPESRLQRRVSKESSSLLARKLELTQSARLAFSAYIRDYCLMARINSTKQHKRNETSGVFNAKALPVEKYANSLGLPFISSLPKEYLQLVPDAVKFIKSFPTVVASSSDNVIQLSTSTINDDRGDELSTVNSESIPSTSAALVAVKDDNIDNTDSDDNLLVRKPLNTFIPNSSELKPLDLVENSSTDDENKNIQNAINELKTSGKSTNKSVICEKIGDIPVAKPLLIADDQIEVESYEMLNIDKERHLLHDIIDKEDKKVWRQRIRERHQAERKKLKEERRKLSQSNGPKITLKEHSFDSNIGESE
ncbi:ATP-dependent RNA helicase DBP4 [Schistosoma japonicum]|nr:ATP-dependent RNA helicase DBP4 [Schistosoma japonicum]KAH8873450.1 ATP-dependent RNA helicase DBP4 [Schistosoma japonicum]